MKIRSIKPIGKNYKYWTYVTNAFAADDSWDMIMDAPDERETDYVLTVGIEGNTGAHANLQWDSVPRVICCDSHPYGLKGIINTLSIMFSSYSYSKHLPATGLESGLVKWDRHRLHYKLPDIRNWVLRPNKTIILCCAKAGGWRFPTLSEYVEAFSSMAARIKEALPGYEIIVRPHPKKKDAIRTVFPPSYAV